MKNVSTLIALAIFAASVLNAQCPLSPLTLSTQLAVDNFPTDYPGCTDLDVNLTIGVPTGTSNINNLNGLNSIQTTNFSIFIRNNPSLLSLAGLSNLSYIGLELTLENNDALTDLTGLENLDFIGGWLNVEGNQNLTTLSGLGPFPSLNSYLYIAFNPSLQDLSGITSLTSVGGFIQINNNNNLTSINGLNGVTQLIPGPSGPGYLYLGSNPSMTAINGFSSLTNVTNNFEIEDNSSLETLDAFGSLSTVGTSSTQKMVISANPNLLSIDDFGSLTAVAGNFTIADNAELTSIVGLANLFTVGGTLSIAGNSSLSDCHAVAVCEHLDLNKPATILGNAFGCQDINQVEIACGLLPVELTYFKGTLEQNAVSLSWQTAMEKNNAWFEIEHSAEGSETFTTLGKVDGKGNSIVLNDYTFKHFQPSGGINYYRLKQVDFDGNFEFSNIVSVSVRRDKEISISPNPTNGPVFLRGLKETGERSATVTDFAGRVVLRKDLSESAFLDLSEQPTGTYIVEIQTDKEKIVKRVVKE